ncbi:hypothetical protein FISHEDRAFT_64911 [Fistulina hepatica ATCC 64428]|uniref:Cyclin N-terminal domain-containing protein n=1 Tax=Fistulina hepatica ATCC 64428 TaxID=1128425 RepID=A0A0D7AFV2_9AGAR|nr:hypothetical protein FISHEDRAFT_64911 [Fistulina hepatica ATCC 64428]
MNSVDYSRAPRQGTMAPRPSTYQSSGPCSSQPQHQVTTRGDPFYGLESVSRICSRFVRHLFACPEIPSVTGDPSNPAVAAQLATASRPSVRLPYFIAYALHRTKLHQSVVFAALILLQRLKARFPRARGSSGHRLFIAAYMIASKIMCDDTYSNKSWAVVAQNLFNLREINQMEREMCGYLDWELVADGDLIKRFQADVERDFLSPEGPYPNYSYNAVSKRALKPTNMPPRADSSSPIPAFGQGQTAASAAPRPPPQSSHAQSPSSPDTPSPYYSEGTSPASTASPQTPVGPENNNVTIQTGSPSLSILSTIPNIHPLKGRMYAKPVPSKW